MLLPPLPTTCHLPFSPLSQRTQQQLPRDPAPQAPATKIPYYLRLLSYMLLDWAQILKGSGFLARVPSAGMSCWGRPGSGWTGAGGAAVSVERACVAWSGEESEGALRWLDTLCWELPWLSFLSNCCCASGYLFEWRIKCVGGWIEWVRGSMRVWVDVNEWAREKKMERDKT